MLKVKRISSNVHAQLRIEFIKSISGENSYWFKSGHISKTYQPKKTVIGYTNPRKGMPSSNKGKPSLNKGRTHTDETKAKIRITSGGERNGMFGKHHIEESKILQSSYDKSGERNGMFGKNHTNHTKQKQSDVWKSREFIVCPHCSYESISAANMKRWHFDNCKYVSEPFQVKR